MHCSMWTEKTYAGWSRWFNRFHGLRHPVEMGASGGGVKTLRQREVLLLFGKEFADVARLAAARVLDLVAT